MRLNYMLPLFIINPTEKMELSTALLVAVIGIIVVLAELALLSVFIRVLSVIIKKFTKTGKNLAYSSVQTDTANTPGPAGEAPGKTILTGVDDPTAAVIMAIVSNKSGIPLERLNFKSIKLKEDK